jgi:RNA polymerase sigma-70 factor (sigma-E family)
VETRWHSLLRLAYLLTGDRGRAEDLVQSALVRVHRHWRRVERADGHDAYARRTMINLNISWWRRRRVEEHLVDQLPEPPAARGHADAHADRDQLVRGLATLPPRMRAVIVLRYYEELSEAECAAALGCSLGTVKSQTSRGLERLRAALADASATAASAGPQPKDSLR